MVRWMSVALVVVLLGVGGTPAQEKGGKAPVGSWVREVNEASVRFDIKPATLRVTLNAGGNQIVVDADYGVSKDRVLFGRITKVDGDGPAEGTLFSFRFERQGEALTVSELQGPDNERGRELVQGEYKAAGKGE